MRLNLMQVLVPPSLRFELREVTAFLREQLGRACLWRWKIVRFKLRDDSQFNILYVGRKNKLEKAKALLAANGDHDAKPLGKAVSKQTAFVYDAPVPGALCVPFLLSSIIPLGRPIEEITENFHSQLRRDLRKYLTSYRLQQVMDSDEIERIDREMLRPYAIARHGVAASQIGLDEVKRVAQKYGRLDLLLLGDDVVGCQLEHEFSRGGKRFWTSMRCGYPESVFSDPKIFRDSNAINIHLALEWAIENGYDYYDMGVAMGRPGDGLLEWKRRRGGELDTMGNGTYFYIRLPKEGAAQFLWDAPLFSVERKKLSLHLGLPDGPNDEEIATHYREMGYRGLFKVCLHCAKIPNEQLLETLRGLYAHQKPPPILEIISST